MDKDFEISAEKRDVWGTGASRRLRHNGKVPAVIYGGDTDNIDLVLEHNEIWTHLQIEAFHSHILSLKVGDQKESVVLREVQYHPYKPMALHLDFLRVQENQALRMRVPVHFTGEEQTIGVKQKGGIVSHLVSDIEIECLPKDLPEYIEVDVSQLDLDESIHLSELKLPEGVSIPELELGEDHDQIVVAIHLPKVTVEEEADEEAAEGVEASKAEDEPKPDTEDND